MPTTVQFIMTSAHDIQRRQNGSLIYVPAIPSRAGLYIIDHNGFYIGTSRDLKERFQARLAALWELGVDPPPPDEMNIELYRIEVGGTSTAPDDNGRCEINVQTGPMWVRTIIDVEHLLIRIFTEDFNQNIRNSEKWQNLFYNPFPDALVWSVADGSGTYTGRIAYNGSL